MMTRKPSLFQRVAGATMLAVCAILASGAAVSAQTPTLADDSDAIRPPQHAELVRQLDSDRYAVREAAQQRLTELGAAALEDVGRLALGGSLESATRAVAILVDWSNSDNRSLALGALERLAALPNRPIESAMAADRLADVREMAAMEALVDLGARVEFDIQRQMVIGAMPSIHVVFARNWQGSVDELDLLADLRRATTISFYCTPIDGDDVVAHLHPAEHPQWFEFYGTEISTEAQEKLAEALPNAIIEVRGGARLGIAADANVVGNIGAPVGRVQPGTSADDAGLQAGDRIIEIDGVEVADFAALTREIAKAEPGDTINLKVMRPAQPGLPNLEPIDIEVTFKSWGDETPINPEGGSPLDGPPRQSPTRVFVNGR